MSVLYGLPLFLDAIVTSWMILLVMQEYKQALDLGLREWWGSDWNKMDFFIVSIIEYVLRSFIFCRDKYTTINYKLSSI